MDIIAYREIASERMAAIDKVIKSTRKLNSLFTSTHVWQAIECLELAHLEVKADLERHEIVAANTHDSPLTPGESGV